jgi:diguanylate cyclase (GGDEF)-like protein
MGAKQLQLARRQKKGVYLLYADVDHMKEINDEYGHQEGDQALIEIANLLRSTYRESDIVARIGGDEFVVVPIGSTGDNIDAILNRLTTNLDIVNVARKRRYNLSLSVGVAYFDPDHPCTVDELLAAGDRFMYEEKKRKMH